MFVVQQQAKQHAEPSIEDRGEQGKDQVPIEYGAELGRGVDHNVLKIAQPNPMHHADAAQQAGREPGRHRLAQGQLQPFGSNHGEAQARACALCDVTQLDAFIGAVAGATTQAGQIGRIDHPHRVILEPQHPNLGRTVWTPGGRGRIIGEGVIQGHAERIDREGQQEQHGGQQVQPVLQSHNTPLQDQQPCAQNQHREQQTNPAWHAWEPTLEQRKDAHAEPDDQQQTGAQPGEVQAIWVGLIRGDHARFLSAWVLARRKARSRDLQRRTAVGWQRDPQRFNLGLENRLDQLTFQLRGFTAVSVGELIMSLTRSSAVLAFSKIPNKPKRS